MYGTCLKFVRNSCEATLLGTEIGKCIPQVATSIRVRLDGLRSKPALPEREDLPCISTERAKPNFAVFAELRGADQFQTGSK
jgi:hypothetical protein